MNPSSVLWALSMILGGMAPAFADQKTTVYTYNPDGALTSIEVTEAGGQKTTTFLTWDNFIPNETDASSGVLSTGDGNLVSLGDEPGGEASFVFDTRARLIAQGQGARRQLYDYHPDSILSETTLGNGERRFYHNRGKFPQTANIAEKVDGKERLSARLGPNRYLSDGTQQSLLTPRKDVTGILNGTGDGLVGQSYGPFGDPVPPLSEESEYNLTDPPEGFAGEYTDPGWGGVYLRARWYDPEHAQFISRDPRPNLNRFAYGDGNPVANVDPGGLSAHRSLGEVLARTFEGRGIAGDFASLFLMPIVGPMEIAANPRGFWEGIAHNRGNMDVFLALGIATEGLSIGFEEFGWSSTVRNWDPITRIRARRSFDLG
ncbi:MAG: RHS repeat-associated core domain-containing protein, partial [Pseudomonadota bacterium]